MTETERLLREGVVPEEPTLEYLVEGTSYAAQVIAPAPDIAIHFWDLVRKHSLAATPAAGEKP